MRAGLKKFFKKYGVAVVLMLFGFVLKFWPHATHELGPLPAWELLEEVGTFLALVFALHLFYDIFIKEDAQKQFVESMKSELAVLLEPLKASVAESRLTHQAINASVTRLQKEVEDSNRIMKQLRKNTATLGGLAVQIDFMMMGEEFNGKTVTETDIYQKAVAEIKKAKRSIDVFTSYLLEVDSEDHEAKRARGIYFASLLALSRNNAALRYRRIIQLPKGDDFIKTFGEKSKTYLNHIREMEELEDARKPVHTIYIDKRRPTTYAIIDDETLLWQINQIVKNEGEDDEMKIYGMFIVKDPKKTLITHFRREFDRNLNAGYPYRLHYVAGD